MSTHSGRDTAKIYSFPTGGRGGIVKPIQHALDDTRGQAGAVVTWDSWYHDAAIRESDRSRKS